LRADKTLFDGPKLVEKIYGFLFSTQVHLKVKTHIGICNKLLEFLQTETECN